MFFRQIRDRYRLWMLPGMVVLTVSMGFIQFSCYPGDEITASETDVVVTFYDPNVLFSGKSYAMPDSVIHVSDPDLGIGSGTHVYDQQILSRIRQNLLSYGYTEAANPADADVFVLVSSSTTEWSASGCYWYYDWWYGYPGYCYPVAYTFNTGTVIIVMVDADNAVRSDAMWFAGLNGMVSGSSTSGISSRINQGIDQAFDQSPYLK
jgi:hypothetical protein